MRSHVFHPGRGGGINMYLFSASLSCLPAPAPMAAAEQGPRLLLRSFRVFSSPTTEIFPFVSAGLTFFLSLGGEEKFLKSTLPASPSSWVTLPCICRPVRFVSSSSRRIEG